MSHSRMVQQAVVVPGVKGMTDHRPGFKFALFDETGEPVDFPELLRVVEDLQKRVAELEASQFAPFKDTGDNKKS